MVSGKRETLGRRSRTTSKKKLEEFCLWSRGHIGRGRLPEDEHVKDLSGGEEGRDTGNLRLPVDTVDLRVIHGCGVYDYGTREWT